MSLVWNSNNIVYTIKARLGIELTPSFPVVLVGFDDIYKAYYMLENIFQLSGKNYLEYKQSQERIYVCFYDDEYETLYKYYPTKILKKASNEEEKGYYEHRLCKELNELSILN